MNQMWNLFLSASYIPIVKHRVPYTQGLRGHCLAEMQASDCGSERGTIQAADSGGVLQALSLNLRLGISHSQSLLCLLLLQYV